MQPRERNGAFTVSEAVAWLEDREGPWFAWIHLYDGHSPYRPPEPYGERYYRGDPRDPGVQTLPPLETMPAEVAQSLSGITDVDWVVAQYEGEVAFMDA